MQMDADVAATRGARPMYTRSAAADMHALLGAAEPKSSVSAAVSEAAADTADKDATPLLFGMHKETTARLRKELLSAGSLVFYTHANCAKAYQVVVTAGSRFVRVNEQVPPPPPSPTIEELPCDAENEDSDVSRLYAPAGVPGICVVSEPLITHKYEPVFQHVFCIPAAQVWVGEGDEFELMSAKDTHALAPSLLAAQKEAEEESEEELEEAEQAKTCKRLRRSRGSGSGAAMPGLTLKSKSKSELGSELGSESGSGSESGIGSEADQEEHGSSEDEEEVYKDTVGCAVLIVSAHPQLQEVSAEPSAASYATLTYVGSRIEEVPLRAKAYTLEGRRLAFSEHVVEFYARASTSDIVVGYIRTSLRVIYPAACTYSGKRQEICVREAQRLGLTTRFKLMQGVDVSDVEGARTTHTWDPCALHVQSLYTPQNNKICSN